MKNLITLTLSIYVVVFIFCNNIYAQNSEEQYIQFEIHTGEEKGAGTDMDIDIRIINSQDVYFARIRDISQYIHGNALERGTTDRFSYRISGKYDIGYLEVKVANPSKTRIEDDWYLERIIIKEKDGTKSTFLFNHWIRHASNGVYRSQKRIVNNEILNAKHFYNAVVYTGDIRGAGTNANVYLTLHTELGDGPPIKLNSRISGNAFERGDVNHVNFTHQSFDELKYINIRHDNKGAGAGWYLQKIKLLGKTFHCNCWMEGSDNGRSLTPN